MYVCMYVCMQRIYACISRRKKGTLSIEVMLGSEASHEVWVQSETPALLLSCFGVRVLRV